MTDPDSGWPAWRRLADTLRARITSGELAPGDRLPSEESLQQEHGLSRTTVRRAIMTLRSEGLVVVDPPRPTRVRERPDAAVVDVYAGTVTARMPTPAERRQLDLGDGVPVMVVELDGEIETFPGDRTALRIVPRG